MPRHRHRDTPDLENWYRGMGQIKSCEVPQAFGLRGLWSLRITVSSWDIYSVAKSVTCPSSSRVTRTDSCSSQPEETPGPPNSTPTIKLLLWHSYQLGSGGHQIQMARHVFLSAPFLIWPDKSNLQGESIRNLFQTVFIFKAGPAFSIHPSFSTSCLIPSPCFYLQDGWSLSFSRKD